MAAAFFDRNDACWCEFSRKTIQDFQRLLKGLGELSLLLIAPGVIQSAQPPVQAAHQGLQVIVEAIQIAGKTPQLGGSTLAWAMGKSPPVIVASSGGREQ